MNRTITTKLVSAALAVASLGLTASAQAAEEQGIVAGEQDVQVQQNTPAPAENTGAEEQAPATQAAQEEEEIDYSSPEYFKSKEARDRFERYCNMKDAEPSHSDKKFCEDFRRHNGTTTTTTSGHGRPDYCKYVNVRYDPKCDKWHPKPHPKPHPEKPEYEKPEYEKDQPVASKKAEEPSKGSLPFTGLEIWQLGLIGIVLVGGGIGARRLLVS